jgi:hypothetical protein
VRGKNDHNATLGFLAGTDPKFNQPAGVYGESNNSGVVGFCKGPLGAGMLGAGSQAGSNFDPAKGGTGVLGSGYIGVRGETQTGVAVLGRHFGSGIAGRFEGDVQITGKLDAPKSTITCFDVMISNADCAEEFDLTCVEDAEPGTVMCLDGNGGLRPSSSAYDKKVAGVVSGAGEYKPGIILDRQHGRGRRAPLALFGKVYCKVDADACPIEVGDLLTTSSRSGHAMRAENPLQAFGAVIGKALSPLTSGQGLIPVLVALQ